MTSAETVVARIEEVGGVLAMSGKNIRVRLPEVETHLLDELRAHKDGVLAVLMKREQIPSMPPSVRLLRWEPKPAPVMLTHYAVVTNVRRFVSMTLLELKAAIAGKHWQSGHRSARELVDRLEQCGVFVEIESASAGEGKARTSSA